MSEAYRDAKLAAASRIETLRELERQWLGD